ncbi:tripartite tricarboxylate transporter substrate binding protein [Roseomonas eburnea]|uniref:Tripartite tricarboxylate transporter substrate binding protein n=1 Tax=Neoroseomonas eburnea TaxID=1346889 RepID=A0A9X9XC61_9PROT|nr:tripartite tricarboxylate transporter substrate binding protein [Neoroseomonas eburnea]MBR0681297.1 tripartite tricarboxylate transporter substrate binding protein [Neoroseomonas eburnea]
MIARRHLLAATAATPFGLARPTLLRAETFPSRPIRVVVPFSAGGGTDVLTRILARGMTEKLGQQVVVENRTGAGGNLAMENVIRSPADGYSLMMGTNGAIAVNRHLYRNMGFDPLTDFAPVSLAFRIEHLMAVTAGLQARSVAEVVALAKAEPGALTFGSGGSGSMIHLAGELFRYRTGIDIVHVPYRGGGPAMNDLVAGNISMMFDSLPSAEPHVRGGRVRALALCGPQRHPLMPDLPTMQEAGVPGYAAASTGALFAPRGTPPEIVARLGAAVRELVENAAFREQLGRSGGDAAASTPAELAQMMAQESEQWGQVVRAANITTN